MVRRDDTEATQLMLETLFDIRVALYDIHDAILGEDEDGEAQEKDA